MNEHTQQKIGVVGGGLMGHGIAYLFAAAGHHVNVFEPFPICVTRCRSAC